MAKVRIKASQEAFDTRREDSGDFALPKPGIYVLQVGECEPGYTKDAEGEPDESKPHLKFTYKIVGVGEAEAKPTENYGSVWDYVSFGEKSDWKRAEMLIAYGIATSEFDGEIDTDDLVNRKVLARIKHEKGRTKDDPKQAKIARLFPYGQPIADQASADVDYGNDAFEADEPFGADEDTASADTGVNEAQRRDELQAMDLKSLGALMKGDYDMDPTTFIVKGANGKVDGDATKAACINAIMEREGFDSPTEDEDDDNPF